MKQDLDNAINEENNAIQERAVAEEKQKRISRELRNKKELHAWFEIIEQVRAQVQTLSNDMTNATSANPPADTAQIVEEINNFAKSLDLKLFPEEKDDNSKKPDRVTEIKAILDRGDIDQATKLSMIQALAA